MKFNEAENTVKYVKLESSNLIICTLFLQNDNWSVFLVYINCYFKVLEDEYMNLKLPNFELSSFSLWTFLQK